MSNFLINTLTFFLILTILLLTIFSGLFNLPLLGIIAAVLILVYRIFIWLIILAITHTPTLGDVFILASPGVFYTTFTIVMQQFFIYFLASKTAGIALIFGALFIIPILLLDLRLYLNFVR